MKEEWTIVFYDETISKWIVDSGITAHKLNLGSRAAKLMAFSDTSSPIIVEKWRAPFLVNTLNASRDELDPKCSECMVHGGHKMNCSAGRRPR